MHGGTRGSFTKPSLPTIPARSTASISRRPLRETLPELGKDKQGTNAKARRLLGWAPRTTEDAIVATAESLMQLGLVK
jgi:nucleoside-diphosphate-sugar epimerase